MNTPAPVAKVIARPEKPTRLTRWVPGVSALRGYRAGLLLRDVFAGLTLTTILVPAGMAYADASGLPAINGLYATIVSLIVYAVFGPSRILVVGPDSALAALIAASIVPLSAGDPERAVMLAGVLSLLAGSLCLFAGLTGFGFITDLLSKPIRYGYLNGIAITVLVGRSSQLLGFSTEGHSFLQNASGLVKGLKDGQANGVAAAIGITCLVVILGCRRWTPRIPGILFSLIAAGCVCWMFSLTTRAEVSVIGALPQGLPGFSIPVFSVDDIAALLSGAAAIALVSFADTSVLSRAMAIRTGQPVDPNQELIALGSVNLATGIFQGFPVSGSSTRTPVAETAGAKTQVAGLVGATSVALLLLIAPGIFMMLPTAALAAVVISSCLGLLEISAMRRLYRLRRSELVWSLACFLGVTILGAIQGIFIAVSLALLAFIWRAWRPHDAVLGRVDGMKGYHDLSRHPEARRIPGLVLFRWDAPLFFANAEIFSDHVLRAVAEAPTPTKWVVVAAEPVTDIDITAADVLSELDETLHQQGMDLCFAELKGPVKDRLKKYGLFTKLGSENFFPTIGLAVDRFLEKHDVQWRDWDEQT